MYLKISRCFYFVKNEKEKFKMDWLKELLEGIKVEDNKIDVASLQKIYRKENKRDYNY
ncbi:hypothetical protein BER40_001489 [Clostridioides difficile]|nr:hypothetical protein BER40_001489 [Clostridioides difficile]